MDCWFFIIFSETEQTILAILGNVTSPQVGEQLNLFITKPDSSVSLIILTPDNAGNFYTEHGIDPGWPRGNYVIQAIYQGQEVGSVTFVITEIFHTTETQQESNTESESLTETKSNTIISTKSDRAIETISEAILVPNWVKHNAKWWSDGAISDKDFAFGIGFLLKEDIIKVHQITSEKERTAKNKKIW